MVEPNLAYCQSCGAALMKHSSFSSRQPYDTVGATTTYRVGKRPWIALGLALIFGIFALWGIGHIYAGKFARGIGLFFIGLFVGGLFWLSVILSIILVGYVGMALFGIFFLGGWVWQAFDAYGAAQEYNELHVPQPRSSW
jgi:hypothetical protein